MDPLQDVLECLPCGVLIVDASSGDVLVRNRIGALLLRESAKRVREPLTELVKPNLAEAVLDVFEDVRCVGYAVPRPLAVSLGGRATMTGGLSGSLLRGADGLDAAVLVLQDMTAAAELERQRQESADKKDLLAEAAHEIRNPLTGLIGFLELLEAREDRPRHRSLLARASLGAQRAVGMVREMLETSRLEASDAKLQRLPIDLGALAEQVVSDQLDLTPDAELRLDVEPDLPRLLGDPTRLLRACRNLVENAVKYSPRKSEVAVSVRRVGARVVEFRVSDQGVGIDPEDLPRIFERFYRARSARKISGTGLGLAMVRAVIEAHGGVIRAESQLGEGTTLVVRLPVEGGTKKMAQGAQTPAEDTHTDTEEEGCSQSTNN